MGLVTWNLQREKFKVARKLKVGLGVCQGRVESLSASQHLQPAHMAQSKRTCESAYKDGFMAAWAETDVGETTAH